MADIWVTSDTHFNHANILKFTDDEGNLTRRFDSLDDMNEVMIDRWNSRVKPGDKVYHLGDVFFGRRDQAPEILVQLNGRKRLVLGNHDDNHKLEILQDYFEKIMLWRVWPDEKMIFSHIPLHESVLAPRIAQYYVDGEVGPEPVPVLNVHGHIHQNKSPDGPYKCVCVEQTDYYPINIEELRP